MAASILKCSQTASTFPVSSYLSFAKTQFISVKFNFLFIYVLSEQPNG